MAVNNQFFSLLIILAMRIVLDFQLIFVISEKIYSVLLYKSAKITTPPPGLASSRFHFQPYEVTVEMLMLKLGGIFLGKSKWKVEVEICFRFFISCSLWEMGGGWGHQTE